jgi:hypothetical protein
VAYLSLFFPGSPVATDIRKLLNASATCSNSGSSELSVALLPSRADLELSMLDKINGYNRGIRELV